MNPNAKSLCEERAKKKKISNDRKGRMKDRNRLAAKVSEVIEFIDLTKPVRIFPVGKGMRITGKESVIDVINLVSHAEVSSSSAS